MIKGPLSNDETTDQTINVYFPRDIMKKNRLKGCEYADLLIENISLGFGSLKALDNVSFRVKRNEILSIMGQTEPVKRLS